MPAKSNTLDVLRVLMNMLDELAASMEKSALVLEKYDAKLDALNNFNVTDTGNMTQTMASLPPDRAAAFVMAIGAMSSLLTAAERNEAEPETQFTLVAYMRSHLHMALEGESVPVLPMSGAATLPEPKHSLTSFFAKISDPISIPVNPQEIVDVSDSSFEVHTGKMGPYVPCLVRFDGSEYLAWKDKDGALVLVEVA